MCFWIITVLKRCCTCVRMEPKICHKVPINAKNIIHSRIIKPFSLSVSPRKDFQTSHFGTRHYKGFDCSCMHVMMSSVEMK